MRIIPAVCVALLFTAPTPARAQGVSLQASAGPTLADEGSSVAGGVGYSPVPRITLSVNVERSHLVSRRDEFSGGSAYFRGGTFTLGSAGLRASLFAPDRISPYALVGFAAGRSRPNVNDVFPTPVVNSVRAPFAGGGVQVPLGPHAALFADLRLALIVGTDSDELYALTPLRAGLSWRF